MSLLNKRESLILFIGDIFVFYVSLIVMYFLRYGDFGWNSGFAQHLFPFSLLFSEWVLTFFILGLYEKQTLALRNKLPILIINAQVVNIFFAGVFFYFVPYFSITPKTNLLIYLVISIPLVLIWRLIISPKLESRKRQSALLIGTGSEIEELMTEVNNNKRYGFYFVNFIDLNNRDLLNLKKDVMDLVANNGIEVIVINLNNEKIEPVLPYLYNLIFQGVRFIDKHRLYEDIFDRVPLSIVKHGWFLENVASTPRRSYDILKRSMDIFLSLILGAISLIFYPFLYVAIKMEDGGSFLIMQKRIGKNSRMIKTYKIRSMERNEEDPTQQNKNKITRIGSFIRKTRIDEIPQLWSVFIGEMSLIGPRPELPSAVKLYEEQIPYYGIRHLIKPGLSGWAQLYQENHPHHTADIKETRTKLSYDLFYIKNRSLLLDIKIALKTIKTILSRSGI